MRDYKLGRRVLDRIDADPGCLIVDTWGMPKDEIAADPELEAWIQARLDASGRQMPGCGTVACLGGWTLLEHGDYIMKAPRHPSQDDADFIHVPSGLVIEDPGAEAAGLLGLSSSEMYRRLDDAHPEEYLFAGGGGPDDDARALAWFRELVESAERHHAAVMAGYRPGENDTWTA